MPFLPLAGTLARMTALLLASFSVALAHLPHDNIVGVAAPADMSDGVPWFAVGDPSRLALLYKSEDGGITWEMVGGEPTIDELTGAAMLEDGTPVLLAADRIWWSEDGGESWLSTKLPAASSGIGADAEVVLGTRSGLYTGDISLGLSKVVDGAIRHVHVDAGGAMAIDEDDGIWLREGSAWTLVEPPAADLTAGMVAEGQLFVGNEAGEIWRQDTEGWTLCGALSQPTDDRFWIPFIVQLAYDPLAGALLVANGWRAPYSSVNNCETWRDTGSTRMDTYSDTQGGAESPNASITSLMGWDSRWALAGWAGFGWSGNGGGDWAESWLVPADYTRGLAFSPTFDQDHAVYIGGYAAGVIRTFDGGATFDPDAQEMFDTNVQKIRVKPPEAGDLATTVYAVTGHHLWISTDAAGSWQILESNYLGDHDVAFLSGPERLWVYGTQGGPMTTGAVGESKDAGKTWGDLPALNAALGDAFPYSTLQFPWGEDSRICVSGYAPSTVVCSADNGATFAQGMEGVSVIVTDVVAWPPASPTRVLVADDEGFYTSTDGGSTFTRSTPTGEDGIEQLVMADDGTLFIATRSSTILRSTDGGDSFTAVTDPLPGLVYVLSPRPGFDRRDDLLLGTHNGMYLLEGASSASPTLSRWANYERIDDLSPFMICDGCVERIEREDASLLTVMGLPEGADLVVGVRGHTVTVVGEAGGASSLRLMVDGVLQVTFGDSPSDGITEVVRVDGLTDGWHTVEIVADSGEDFVMDAIEAYGDGALLDLTGGGDTGATDTGATDTGAEDTGAMDTGPGDSGTPGPKSRCSGCGGGGAWLLLPLLGLRRRRG